MGFTLVLGGARSGKSSFAQRAAETAATHSAVKPVMIVTAQIYDHEMAERVARHQDERGDLWMTVEAPIDLSGALARFSAGDVVVIDCMTLWLTNVMLSGAEVDPEIERLLQALDRSPAKIWVVSNEVGWGIVPDNALARSFRDEAGRLNQRLAAMSDRAVLIVAGMKLELERC